MAAIWVAKLGGSIANSSELPKWLDTIGTSGAGRVVVVPGGGPWADEVRAAQQREGFDDRQAHREALRSMEQYGKFLMQKRPDFAPAADITRMRQILHDGRVAVWMPYDMVTADPTIPESWDVTSDSLAAWLATRLDASGLLLVKSFALSGDATNIAQWVQNDWVDPAFGKFTLAVRYPILIMGNGDQIKANGTLASAKDKA